jgi:hypothetical protein
MTMNDDAKPGPRRLWHSLVENGIATAIPSGTPFTVERVLDSVGIHSLSLHRERAFEYANKMLAAHTKAATTNPRPPGFECFHKQKNQERMSDG